MKYVTADVAIDECSFRHFQHGCGNRSLHFWPRRIGALDLQVNTVRSRNAQVIVGIVDSGNHRLAVQVDLFSVGTGERSDFVGIASSNNPVPADRRPLHIGMCGGAGKDLPVEEN